VSLRVAAFNYVRVYVLRLTWIKLLQGYSKKRSIAIASLIVRFRYQRHMHRAYCTLSIPSWYSARPNSVVSYYKFFIAQLLYNPLVEATLSELNVYSRFQFNTGYQPKDCCNEW
jgi:hypothetical protein